MLNKMATSRFLSDSFEKRSEGGNLFVLQCFYSLKKGTKALNFYSKEPSLNILGLLDQYDSPWEQKGIAYT